MKIALCQQEIIFERKSDNIEKIKKFAKKAADKRSDIIFFPETSLTGFSMNIERSAEKTDGNINIIKRTAAENHIYIGFGWIKYVFEKAENHYSIISPEGECICDYIKIHPFSYAGENKYFIGGNETVLFNICGITFSVFICYDLRFPEIFQAVSKDADIIAVAANWPEERKEHWKILLKARAVENQCYIIGVNCFGKQGRTFYSGDSAVYTPDGKVICLAGEKEDMRIFDFYDDTKKYREDFPVKNDRKNELYKKLF